MNKSLRNILAALALTFTIPIVALALIWTMLFLYHAILELAK
ncbi:MAG: hypothetical protein V4563_14880 [Pseudomonadota bacterium]